MLMVARARLGHHNRLYREEARALITIHLSADDLARVRMAPSPLWETLCSFGELTNPHRHSVHAPWARRTRQMLSGADMSPLVAVMGIGGRCPDYLSPPPEAPNATFRDELERLESTPPEVIHDEVEALMREEAELLGRLPHEKVRMLGVLEDPEGSLKQLVDALDRYHELAIDPYWPRIREHLEADVLRRGQALVLGGAETFFSGLNSRVDYRGGVLKLDQPHEATVDASGRGITLVPCAFSWPDVLTLVDPRFRPTLAYAPRGVANLWTTSRSTANGTALEAALSPARASVLKSLLMPRTTTELAQELGLSPAAISAHLSRLKAAGLTESHRSGKRVYYRLSIAGESLLEIFGGSG
jgi:DNA-binding CsgD family transcriptional regulator